MAFSLALHSPPKWVLFRLAALKRARLMRHLTPTLASKFYLGAERSSDEPPSDQLHDLEENSLDEFVYIEVEQTVFKVHVSLFRLEAWMPVDNVDSAYNPSENTADPIILSDTAENFRYFLWDLQAFPHELSHLTDDDCEIFHVVGRLLNIAEMANKHNLSALEARALESLRYFVLSPHFRSAPSAFHCRALSLATRSNLGHDLLRDLSRRLIHHILRQPASLDPALVSIVEQNHRLRKIQGIIYYRQLVDMEQHIDGRATTQPVFLPSTNVERRMRFLAAHISLSTLSARLWANAPPFPTGGCPSHSLCIRAWENIWGQAAAASQTAPLGSADVLGRLRAMMPILNPMVRDAPTISIECGLAALEAVVSLRDGLINGLMDHFA
ncbi:hypothetical protein DFH09DRAFT_263968 [Mycena vulgaris]|nr:hypothetical protein DFH09DRAFT_263968 [Mycena vulgaris]